MEGEDAPYLKVSGLSIYSESDADLEALLPASVRIDIGNGTYDYQIGNNILAGAYSPSGNRMDYYAALSSGVSMDFPTETEFDIAVTVTPAEGEPLIFTESVRCPMTNSLTAPNSVTTGTAAEFTLTSAAPTGASYRNEASLVWMPQAAGYYTTQIYEEGYVDPYTKVSEASSDFLSVYFAVANPDELPTELASNARVGFSTYYLSDDFTDGCMITDLETSVMVTPGSTVDSTLAPEITSVTITADPSEAVVDGKYVHKKATLTFTPVVRFKYGDSIAYLSTDELGNRYGASISAVAVGITPGEEYTRPDTEETETADDTSVRAVTLRATGRKWKLQSNGYMATYQVLYYLPPRITTMNVYRMAVSSIATPYRYNGTYYKKDDFGAYGMAEFQVSFSSLDGENQTSMTLQYGTHRISVTPDATGYGFVVFPANTAVSLNVNIVLYDNFMPYGVAATRRLSTASILIDYLSGGKGMAIGKAATEQSALDIASDWKLLFYQATVGSYNGDDEQDLIAWMRQVDDRLEYLENSIYAN